MGEKFDQGKKASADSALVDKSSPFDIRQSLRSEMAGLIEANILIPTEVWMGNSEARRRGVMKVLAVGKELDGDEDSIKSGFILTQSGRLWKAPFVEGLYDGTEAEEVVGVNYIEAQEAVEERIRLERELKELRDKRRDLVNVKIMNAEYFNDFRRMIKSNNPQIQYLFYLLPELERQRLLKDLPRIDFNRSELFADELDYESAVERDAFEYKARKGDMRMGFIVRSAKESYTEERYHVTAFVVAGKDDELEAISVTFGENGRLFRGRDWEGNEIDATQSKRSMSYSPESRALQAILADVVTAAREIHQLPIAHIQAKDK